ncbi:group-specific protein [Paenibacillus albiflavus]|uniref:Group-specific protein n=1 Tax=Paenibacillus albiflavus TaxID=2545760 RepID=A0A4R4EL45_9BACL|nr:group-specific protein [Paenibacillus albiflavus]TCZ80954.1 group-specific protein [Paenibacillus albiflavus]
MKFYVASSFKNIDIVRSVSNCLINRGYIHTYDWTQNNKATTLKHLRIIGQHEKQAVLESDFVIVILPAGKGSHIELGLALGQGIPIYLYSPNNDIDDFETTSTFYHLDGIVKCRGTIDSLIEQIDKRNRKG